MDAVRLTFTDPRLGAVVMPVGYEVTYVPGHARPSDTPIYDELVAEMAEAERGAHPLIIAG
jgi:hypothetical protein